MIQKGYTIFDNVSKEFTVPFFCVSDEAACRIVKSSFSPQSSLVLYPSDYTLCCIGSFDTDEGNFESGRYPVKDIKDLIPVFLRNFCLDGTFERGVEDETKKDSPAQG